MTTPYHETKTESSYDVAEAPSKDIESGSIRTAPDHGQGELEVGKIQQGNKALRKMRAAESWLDRKFKVEGMGAERVLVQDRKHPHVFFVSCSSQSIQAHNHSVRLLTRLNRCSASGSR